MKRSITLFLICCMMVLASCSRDNDNGGELQDEATNEATVETSRENPLPDYTNYSVLPVGYSLEDAKADRCVVLEDLVMTSGAAEWDAFVELTHGGEAAMIRVAKYYEKSAQLYITDISCDGSIYTVSDYSNTDRSGQYTTLAYYDNIVGTDHDGPTLDCCMFLSDEIENYGDVESTLFLSGASYDPYRIYIKQVSNTQSDEAYTERLGEVWNETEYMEMLKPYLDRNGLPEDYALEDAIADGCVVWADEALLSGEDTFMRFVEDALSGREAAVRIGKYYAAHEALYFTDIAYDGSAYTLTEMDGTGKQYMQMVHCEQSEVPNRSIFEICALVNDEGGDNEEEYLIFSVNLLYLSALATDDEGNWYYPVLPGDEEWAGLLSLSEVWASLNMPEDQLERYSGEDLADLVLDYPFLLDYNAYDDWDYGYDLIISRSNICTEFFSRDDAVDIMLKKYDEMEVDYDDLVRSLNMSRNGYKQELILQFYFGREFDTMTRDQKLKLKRISWEKYEIRKATDYYGKFSEGLQILDSLLRMDKAVTREEFAKRYENNADAFSRVAELVCDQEGTFHAAYCRERFWAYEDVWVIKGKLFIYTDIESVKNLDQGALGQLFDDVILIMDELGFREIQKYDDEYSANRVIFSMSGDKNQQSIIYDSTDTYGDTPMHYEGIEIEQLAECWFGNYVDIELFQANFG